MTMDNGMDSMTRKTGTFKYEELFSEADDGSGDLILTFPKDWGFNVGDEVNIEVVGGSLRINKVVPDWEAKYSELYASVAMMLAENQHKYNNNLATTEALKRWDELRSRLPLPTKV